MQPKAKLDRERLTVYPIIFAVLAFSISGWWNLTGEGLLDRTGKNIGADYLTFWAASGAALDGEPALVWDWRAMHPRQSAAIGAAVAPYAFHYPPTFLLLCLPLSLLPYLASLGVWIVAGVSVFLRWARRAVPDPMALWLALSFPGVYQNIIQGQNGLFTTTLLGSALWALETRPALAGVLLGVLSFKPHLAVTAFFALFFGRRWRALTAAILSAALFILLSLAVLGPAPWDAFFKNSSFAVQVLAMPEVALGPAWARMPTVQVAVMMLGVPVMVARVLQGLSAISALVVLAWVWSKSQSFPARVSALVGALFLVSPFSFDYDQALLALPVAAFGWEILQGRGQPREGWLVVAAWLAPVVIPGIAIITRVQLGPLLSVWLMAAAVQRLKKEQAEQASASAVHVS